MCDNINGNKLFNRQSIQILIVGKGGFIMEGKGREDNLNKSYNNYTLNELLTELKDKYVYLDSETVLLSQHIMEDYFGLDYILNKDSQYSLYDNLFDKLIEPILDSVEEILKDCYFSNFKVEYNKIILQFNSPSINIMLDNFEIKPNLKEIKEYFKYRLEEENNINEDITGYDKITLKEFKYNKNKED